MPQGFPFTALFTRARHRLGRLIRGLLQHSGHLNGQPLNKASLLVIVLVDLVLLVNIFNGMAAIAEWPLSPQQAFPCQAEWSLYQQGSSQRQEKDLAILRRAIPRRVPGQPEASAPEQGFRASALQASRDHLGQVDPLCLEFAGYQDRLAAQSELRLLQRGLNAAETEISALEQSNAVIRSQYDTSLLEQIAGQPSSQALQPVPAAQARRRVEANDTRISTLRAEVVTLNQRLLEAPDSQSFLGFLNSTASFEALELRFKRALFWAPSLSLLLQSLFLLPLVLLSLLIHRLALRRGHGLLALVSWHLLVISLIPLLLKLAEGAQVGVLFSLVLRLVQALVGNLRFLVAYLYLLVVPVLGFTLIKLLQTLVFNPRVQAAERAQRNRCLRCARRLPSGCRHCPHCGYAQFRDCVHCHKPTHRHLPYCSQCGSAQLDVALPARGHQY
ncbi:zinc ribbon domain-containing protein [Synechococcus sp. 1G10]|uniref:zinc ribbon domain-containing protein n=1 Tax=Synechococcus sp. 1G10 TaxID=2025605 RepID=UPI000B98E23E|nr:zinc ribbon domain-containing protein [Synechococcus sp. 1G10]